MNLKETFSMSAFGSMCQDGLWAGDPLSCVRAAVAMSRAESAGVEQALRAGSSDSSPYEVIEESDFDGYDYMVQLINGVAVVSIRGELVPGESTWNRYFGIVGYDELRNAITAAANHSAVEAIVLDVDSGGGAVRGMFEAHDYIASINRDVKPIYTHTSGVMASAAYIIASAATKITSSDMATVGSLGIILVHKEVTKMLQDIGVSATVMRKGEFKALGTPYEKLDNKAKQVFEDRMQKTYDAVMSRIATARGADEAFIRDNAAEGREFFGYEALDVKLVDELAILDNVLSDLGGFQGYNGDGNLDFGANTHEVDDMAANKRKVVIDEAVKAAVASGVPVEEATKGKPAAETNTDEEASTTGNEDQATVEETGAEEAASTPETDQQEETAGSDLASMLNAQISDLQAKLVEAKVEASTLKTELDAVKASVNGLEEIARTAIQKAQIGLGGSPTDQSHLHGEALVAEYHRHIQEIDKRYPSKAQAEVVVEDEGVVHDVLAGRAAKAARISKRGK